MKKIITIIKPYFRWFILGLTLLFLFKNVRERFEEIRTLHLDRHGWLMLVIALMMTVLAHIWSAWVWTWILGLFRQSLGLKKGIKIYLITNIAKYLPGNVWHFYGRISAITDRGGSLGSATISTILEPLLMAASALLIAIISTMLGLIKTDSNVIFFVGQIFILIGVLLGIHPRIINPIIKKLSRSKIKQKIVEPEELKSYPLKPFLGEIGFVLFRASGFLLTFLALKSLTINQFPTLISTFSISWLLGLIVPGAPGGIGVFETSAIAFLDKSQFDPATVLLSVALYRVISILAEAGSAIFAWLIL